MKIRLISLLLVLATLSACTATATPKNEVTTEATMPAAIQQPNTPTAEPTASPTPTPLSLPVDRFTSLPGLSPITLENTGAIRQVAALTDSRVTAFITDDQSKLVAHFASGVQVYDLPGLTSRAFVPIPIAPFSRTETVSSDGKYAARTYPAADHPFKPILSIWDLEAGKEICNIPFQYVVTANDFNLQFHPEQGTFSLTGDIVGRNGGIKVWSLDNCKQLLDLESDTYIAVLSPDGKYAAITDDKQTVVYDMKTRKRVRIGEPLDVRGVGFLSDSGTVIVSYRGRAVFHNIASGENIGEFDAKVGDFYSKVTAVKNGEWVIVSAAERNYFWNSAQNQVYAVNELIGRQYVFQNDMLLTNQSVFNLKAKTKIDLKKYGAYEVSAALSSDGAYVAASAETAPFTTDIYETATGKKVFTLTDVHSPLDAGNGMFIVTGKNGLEVYDPATGGLVRSIDVPYTDGISVNDGRVVVWNALGELRAVETETGSVVEGGVFPVLPLGRMKYIQYENPIPAWSESFGSGLDDLLLSLDRNFSDRSVAVSSDRTVGIRGINQMIQVHQLSGADFSPDSDALLASYDNPYLAQFQFSPDNSIIAGASRSLILWDGKTGAEIKRFELTIGGTTHMQFSPDGTKLVLAGNDGPAQVNVFGNLSLMVFDVTSRRFVQTYQLAQQLRKTGCNTTLPFALTPDGAQIVTLTQDCRIGIFDLQTFTEARSFGQPYKDGALTFALSPDGKILAVAQNKHIELWDVANGTQLKRIPIPQLYGNFDDYFHNVEFSPDGRALFVKSSISFTVYGVTTVWGIPEMP